MTRLLVLRPQPDADATVAKAHKLELDAVAVPLFEIQPVEWEMPETGSFDGLLLRGLKTYAVGEATAAAAREAGFDMAGTGDAGVDRLLGSIEPDLRLLHLCGKDRREPVHARQRITAIAVYRAEPLGPNLGAARGSVALIHSPRAGQRFAELVRDRRAIAVAAISKAAADALGDGWRTVATADQPTDDALLALAARLCDKPDPK